mmetsp:Transcript_41092/g.60307  ORF Transcript_41092/g.60307 Transcript_41092/m.60307 type:complete len:245 (-) Transcript_41092:331-1065(-)|eukprot:CAMPEP_0195507300 /NCGR_PEP_ID=MMETSP0794_2-20130614/772_1 /TAXON_ID=515487 /ORGANISM="Stephanopyxis turris, Strain CCMP 815" /LENGTH=244 /DNA_ID=CAMNT_0040633933 /DNA_START=111 /DNA_END=845 /DNA_ORIENTATION=+
MIKAVLFLLLSRSEICPSFVVRPKFAIRHTLAVSMSSGKGFGNQTPKSSGKAAPQQSDSTPSSTSSSTPLESVGTTSNSSPFGSSQAELSLDPSLPAEDRAKKILSEKYGLKTFEETQLTIKEQEKRKESAERMAALKRKADLGQDLDLFAMIPEPIIVFIDGFLKIGLSICVILFGLAGVAITVEAWSNVSDTKLPENIDNIIVNIIEPNFTPGLLVLLGFSVSLGLFATAQLGSGSSQYTEE